MQRLAGLITSLLLGLYFHEQEGERPSLRLLRRLRRQIRQESAALLYLPLWLRIPLQRDPLRGLYLWLRLLAIF